MEIEEIKTCLQEAYNQIRKKYPEFPFPRNTWCREAARRVQFLGGEIEAGTLYGNRHVWNSFNDRMIYVDISASQYGLPEIIVLSIEDAVHLYKYVPDESLRIFTKKIIMQERKQKDFEIKMRDLFNPDL